MERMNLKTVLITQTGKFYSVLFPPAISLSFVLQISLERFVAVNFQWIRG